MKLLKIFRSKEKGNPRQEIKKKDNPEEEEGLENLGYPRSIPDYEGEGLNQIDFVKASKVRQARIKLKQSKRKEGE